MKPVHRLGLSVILGNAYFPHVPERPYELYDANPYDVILLDLQLPKMDGITVCKLIREHESKIGRRSKIIALTAAATEAGSDRFISFVSIGFYFFIRYYGNLIHDVSDPEHLELIRQSYYKSLNFGEDFEKNLQLFKNNMALEYVTGYLVEYSLSVDNIFVFILINRLFQDSLGIFCPCFLSKMPSGNKIVNERKK
jgi:CheY-like chemotaxis protein